MWLGVFFWEKNEIMGVHQQNLQCKNETNPPNAMCSHYSKNISFQKL